LKEIGDTRCWHGLQRRQTSSSTLHVSPDTCPTAEWHIIHSLCAAAASPAESEDDVPISRFSHCPALVSCYGDSAVPPPCPSLSCRSSSTSPPIARPKPCPTGWRPRLMPSREWLIPICFFFPQQMGNTLPRHVKRDLRASQVLTVALFYMATLQPS
jgi:hypothetical protein